MGSLFGGAAIGAVFGEALKGALETIDKGRKYRSTLQTNIATLEALGPVVEDIIRYSEELDRPREEVETLSREMRAGEELVRRYSNVSPWNFLCFPCYQQKLKEGDESLRRLLSVNVQAEMARDLKEILSKVTSSLMILAEEFGHTKKVVGMGTALYGAPENPEFTVGLDEPLKELKFELLKDGVSYLNLTGFGGSGKTTLAKKLCCDPQVMGKFKQNIFFATFSKTPNLKIIVERLFEHFGQPKPDYQSNEDPGSKLRNLLKQVGGSPTFLVLDDVWPGAESLVEKFKVQISNFKILVTSRVSLNFQSCIQCHLEPLSPENSITLFRHYALLNDSGSGNIDDKLVLEAVKCCGGLPLALQLIGSKLRRKPIEYWQKMVKELSQGRSVLDSDIDLLTFLQKCLDVLEDKSIIRECFMDLGLFPEDQMIPVAALLDMWTELHKLDEEFYAMPFIYELTAKNLSNNVLVTRKVASDADNYYNNHFLMQHDLLRDLAIHLSNQKPFEQRKNLIIDITGSNRPELWSEPKQQGIIARILPKCFIKQKKQQVDARSLSISSGETFTSDWGNMKPDKVEVLVLNLRSNNYTLPGFIKKMRKLKVLILTNYSFDPSQLNDFELLGSLSHLKRIRLQRVSVPCLCQLKNLRKLSLRMCNTSEAFRHSSSSSNIKEALPNLVDMSIDYCKDLVALPAGFCDICPLEKLSITNCHKFSALPQEIGNLKNLQVLRLNSCSDLKYIPDSIKRLQKLSLLDISYCISLSRLPEEIGDLCNLSKLYMMGCSRLSELPSSVTKLEKLEKVICDEEVAVSWKEYFDLTYPRTTIEVAKADNNLHWLACSRC